MRFRPCIDLHDGQVKQIIGSTLSEDANSKPKENFIATFPASYYAKKYRADELKGGHIIMLDDRSELAAFEAIVEYPLGLQIGGGINIENAMKYLNHGASHIIVTSYVFRDGTIDFDRLQQLVNLVGKDRIVLDLSCRRKPTQNSDSQTPDCLFYVVTNKWTKYTNFPVTVETLTQLSAYCDEFLIHGVDVEGKKAGIEEDLVKILGDFGVMTAFPITYAGGIRSLHDIELVQQLGKDRVDITIGSALDIFGGDLRYEDVIQWHKINSSS